jgi:hypothetical protein
MDAPAAETTKPTSEQVRAAATRRRLDVRKQKYHEDPAYRAAQQTRCRENYRKLKEVIQLGRAALAAQEKEGK